MESDQIQYNGWPENRRYIHAELIRLANECKELAMKIDNNFKEHTELHTKMEEVRSSIETAMREKLEKKIDDNRIELVNVRLTAASRGGMYGAIAGIVASIVVGIIAHAISAGR